MWTGAKSAITEYPSEQLTIWSSTILPYQIITIT